MTYEQIISTLRSGWPGAEWSLDGDLDAECIIHNGNIVGLSWHGNSAMPDADEIEAEWDRIADAVALDEARALKAAAVMALRQSKIDGGFTFGGTAFQTRPDDRENVAGAAQLAFMAIAAGAQPDDLRWHGGDSDFVWIAEDNSLVSMDAPTVIDFAKALAAHKSACIFNARALKDAIAAAETVEDVAAIDITVGWP